MTNLTEETKKVSEERGSQYGNFADMAATAQKLKSLLVTDRMTPVQRESMELICTKLSRLAHGNPNHFDSWFDITGYANLVLADLQKPTTIAATPVPVGGWTIRPQGQQS